MTLIVAGINSSAAWMVSDTLITGGTIELRERQYEIKCVPSRDTHALIGFAGDVHHGTRLIENVARMPSGMHAALALADAQRDYPIVDFVYAFLDDGHPKLFKISEAILEEVSSAYIGTQTAFEHFQRIQHARVLEPAPKAVETFIFGSRSPDAPPKEVAECTTSMLRLLTRGTRREVGGWAVPYVLNKQGAFMCGYGYSVSDPILDTAAPGAVVPHGTAEAGGYGLSVCEFGELEGMVVYWRQLPGGILLKRSQSGYDKLEIEGDPTEFRRKAFDALGKRMDIFFGDDPVGLPESLTVLHDDDGNPAMTVARKGRDLTFSVLNVETAFKAKGLLDLGENRPTTMTVKNLTLTLAEDRTTLLLQMTENGKQLGQSTLNASELDHVIAGLGEFRASLVEQISSEPKKNPGSREVVVIDPAWRTQKSPHADVPGVILRLRHIGLGWVSFLLPQKEVSALGKWLTDNAGDA